MTWLAANVPIYAVNVLLSTATDMWALRHPATHQLCLLDRRTDGTDTQFDLRTKRIHAQSDALCARPSVVLATEPMNDDPRWRLLHPGELVHIDGDLQINRTMILPDPPRHLLRRDLSVPVEDAQHVPPNTRKL